MDLLQLSALYYDTPQDAQPSPDGEGRGGSRSREGCWTCRAKKVKCDEVKPQCSRCLRLTLYCDYIPRPKLSGASRPLRNQSRLAIANERVGGASPLPASTRHTRPRHGLTSLSLVALEPPATGLCSLDLTATDHDLIRYFRTSFAKLHHTKNPKFSVFSIMFSIAQCDPVVMHMVLAIGGRETDFRRTRDVEANCRSKTSLQHYSTALGMMSEAIGGVGHYQPDLDSIITALYLMILYEQKYGDDACLGLSKHLAGAATILEYRGRDLFRLPSACSDDQPKPWALTRRAPQSGGGTPPSLYSARLLVWIALRDAAAASYGVGGHLSATLYKLLCDANTEDGMRACDPVEMFDMLHRYSNPLFRAVWGETYPQAELLDDVENRNVFALLGACGQLRFMIAQLAKSHGTNAAQGESRARSIDRSIQQVGHRYTELIEVASELSMATDSSHRLVANIRTIVPHYHAVILEFLRLTRPKSELELSRRQRNALRSIMDLASQVFKHGGDEAITQIAWPLFVAALETDDARHRVWILSRFRGINSYGCNFARAGAFLADALEVQSRVGTKIDVGERFGSGEGGLFVI